MQQEIYWENLAKRSLCRLCCWPNWTRAPSRLRINQAIKEACQGCCEPTEAMVYSTMKELIDGGLVLCRDEEHNGRMRRVCWLTPIGRGRLQSRGPGVAEDHPHRGKVNCASPGPNAPIKLQG